MSRITEAGSETYGAGFVIGGQEPAIVSETLGTRDQGKARRVASDAYPFRCCAVCGLQMATCLQLAHLDHNAGNNAAENLARLCPTHHWMYDAGLYPVEAIKLMQAHWQLTLGKPDHKARMKDAGVKAAVTRKRRAAARKAVATRRAKSVAP